MVTEKSCLLDKDQDEKLHDSPNCASLTAFTLKRIEVEDKPSCPVRSENPSDLEISSLPSPFEIADFASIRKGLKLKQRPWIVYNQFHNEKDSDAKQCDMSLSPKICLPKGVTRGCADCSGCQKVSANWNPAGACTYVLEDAIVFHSNEEDFKDPFKYINSIRKQAEPYGLCRFVPPSSWNLPSFLEEDDIWQCLKFSTKVQRVDRLQKFNYRKESPEQDTRETKRRRVDYEFGDASAANFSSGECLVPENLQVELGPDFSLIAFKRYADDFKQHYFSRENDKADQPKHQELWQPSEMNIEGEYWRIVEKPTEEIEVLYGTNTISGILDCKSSVSSNSGKASDFVEGCTSNWDLINLYRLPGSLLSFETLDSSGILAPKLHIGMCFSSLPWTVEEHRLYKLQYLHMGAPRIWYCIPECYSRKFEAIVKKHLSNSTKKHVERLHRPGKQLSPATLKSEGIPVYRCIQRPGEFILFLPGVYHSGFDCGFNCSTSVVFAPLDWLPHGLITTELYRENRRKTSISYDKVLLKAADEAVNAKLESLLRGKKTLKVLMWSEACRNDGELANSLRARIRSEARSREYLSSPSQSRKMDRYFDVDGRKLECSICCYDLYLSAVSCSCSRTKFSCMVHAKHFCSCPWTERTFYFRYQINELNILAEAVEGKVVAIRTWVKENLGSVLHWDKPNEDQNEPLLDPVSTAVKDMVTCDKVEASGSKLLSKAQEPLLEMNLDDDSKTRAGEFSAKDADDDTSLSSSDFDVEEYITQLEKSWNS